jgi:hypothetical protein
MSNTVFILGAGASRQAGAPLMKDFLDTANYLWKSGNVSEAVDSFEKVFQGISELQQVHSKSQLDIQNVESVFAAFEMGKTLKKFGGYSLDQIGELANAMRQVIVQTIQTTLKLPVSGTRPGVPFPYGAFAELVDYLRGEAIPKSDVSIITFNYDMAIDYSFYVERIPLDYSLGENSGKEGIAVLKLHGSLNWAHCSVCNQVVPWLLNDYLKEYQWNIFPDDDIKYVTLGIGSYLKDYAHCSKDKNVDEEPVIVPPTWNKTQYHATLSNVWSRAAKELSGAENIFVIGYSLPTSDAFFRYLYALGTVGKTPLNRFWVFNPDSSGQTEERFKELLGPGAQARFKYFPKRFDESISIIKNEFPGRR